MHRHRRLIPGFAVLAAAACGRKATPRADSTAMLPPPPAQIAAVFQCDDGSIVQADFRNDTTPHVVVLIVGDDRMTLPQATSADGARYADSTSEFWNKGKNATFTRQGGHTSCHMGMPVARNDS